MDIAYAAQKAGGGFSIFIPLLIMSLPFAFILKSIAKRKRRYPSYWFLAGFVPYVNGLGGIWLASLPDKSIMEEISALVRELQKSDFLLKGDQSAKSEET